MKNLILSIIFLLSLSVFGANQFADGFYTIARDSNSPSLINQNGEKIFIGDKHRLEILRCAILSNNNENSRFQLDVNVPYSEKSKNSYLVLIVDGKAYAQGSGGTSPDTVSYGFSIYGKENAIKVAVFLKTPVVYRKHPDHKLAVSFTPVKKEFNLGEEVIVRLKITNVGNKNVIFWQKGTNPKIRNNQYIFTAYYNSKQVKEVSIKSNFGGLHFIRTIKSGESFEDEVSLSKWFAFDNPGFYEVHGSYSLRFAGPDNNAITNWEDYVSADFKVRIGEIKAVETAQ